MKHTLTIEGTAEEVRDALDKITGRVAAPATTAVVAPVAPAETPAPAAKADDAETPAVDGSGMPYDDSIHATPASMKADGTWKVRKGKAAEAKTARQAFLAGGAGVVPPTPAETAVTDTTKAAPGAVPGMPGGDAPAAIPPATPVTFDEVMGKATAMFNAGNVTGEQLRGFYQETVGVADPQQAAAIYQTNETGRAALMGLLNNIGA